MRIIADRLLLVAALLATGTAPLHVEARDESLVLEECL